jgi:hypothetical protein
VPPPEEPGDLAGVDLVVLGLAAMNGLHVQGMAQDESDAFAPAEIGDPIPGKHALDAND